jgi:periplasmic glucans biosynthesis protein
LRRRDLLLAGAVLPFFAPLTRGVAAPADEGSPFDPFTVRRMAHDLALKPYQAPDATLPDNFKDLSYDRYRAIRFLPDKAMWRGQNLPFELQFFHRGFFFSNRIDMFEVADGRARRIAYSPAMFSFGDLKPPDPAVDLGFGGFRIHGPMNKPDYYDEIAVFLGASYFRAIAKNEVYGLSARGLAIRTADPKGEEFPVFKAFWIERPAPNTNSIVVHGLLDSESAAASYRFTIRPGESTVFDVEMALYPRVEMPTAGLAPLTSMFLFDANDRKDVDDFRPAVHDSDGLAVHNGRGEMLWRPLANPRDLQVSAFADTNSRGFGLMQRQRDFRIYQDLEARYEKRPSLWIEPIGDWGEGAVRLIEIPSKEEIHDNIVAFWRPKDPLRAQGEYIFTYRMHWGQRNPQPVEVAKFTATRVGAGPDGTRLFVLDLAGDVLKDVKPEAVRGAVEASKGRIDHVVTQPNPETGGYRLSFQLAPEDETLVELRARIMRDNESLSEVWLYRWTP